MRHKNKTGRVSLPEIALGAFTLSQPKRSTRIWNGADVDIRLRRFGLSEELLLNAIRAGAFARSINCTTNFPKCYPGLANWAVIVKTLRDDLMAKGWNRYDKDSLEGIVHPDGQTVILVESGDDHTGDPDAENGPSTKYKKGDGIEKAVGKNYFLRFDASLERENQRIRSGESLHSTWFLLHANVRGEIRSELSRPLSIAGGHIIEWSERIILTEIPPESETLMIPEDDPINLDVSVRRREKK